MQLYAYDQSGQIIFSFNAIKKCNYFCLECKNLVRLRDGLHRTLHFYHLNNEIHCKSNGKSLIHLQLQLFLKKILSDEVQLEHRFEKIKRIADVAWITKKIIFEIQCSSLSYEEMKSRIQDYEQEGFKVVFILHDSQFKQFRISELELGLKNHTFYYTNFNKDGHGVIYDQWYFVESGLIKRFLPPLEVDLSKPYFNQTKLGFKGDINSLAQDHPYFIKIKKIIEELANLKQISKLQTIKKNFIVLLNKIIKAYCN